MLSGKVVGIIGAGNMGEVLIRGLIQSGSVKKKDLHALARYGATLMFAPAGRNIKRREGSAVFALPTT